MKPPEDSDDDVVPCGDVDYAVKSVVESKIGTKAVEESSSRCGE